MPYIDKLQRGKFQEIVQALIEIEDKNEVKGQERYNRRDQFWCVVELMNEWLKYYKLRGQKIDGYINYTFTILLKRIFRRKGVMHKFRIDNGKAFIHCIMSDIYTKHLSYSKFQSGFGLLNCMRAEFKRRKWMTPQLSKWFNKTINDYSDYMAKYEDKKIAQNGDV